MSRPRISVYHRPQSLEAAWELVSSGDPAVRLLSGGADLTIHAPAEVTTLVDVGRVLDRSIEVGADGAIHVGAMVTLTEVMGHPAIATHGSGVVPEMMVHVGNPLLRNFSTIGGHIARGKLSDVVPVLLALDSRVRVYDGAERYVSLEDYYGQGTHQMPHIVTALTLPSLPVVSAAAFVRFARTAFDFPILNVCCRVDGAEGGVIGQVRVVVGATPRRATRATAAEALIAGRGLDGSTIDEAAAVARAEVWTGSGWVASAEYRSHLVGVLTARCLKEVAERLGPR